MSYKDGPEPVAILCGACIGLLFGILIGGCTERPTVQSRCAKWAVVRYEETEKVMNAPLDQKQKITLIEAIFAKKEE